MIRRPPRSTLFPTRRSSDLLAEPELARRVILVQVAAPAGLALPFPQPFGLAEDGQGVSLRLQPVGQPRRPDRKSTRLNSSHSQISYAVFCLKKKKKNKTRDP